MALQVEHYQLRHHGKLCVKSFANGTSTTPTQENCVCARNNKHAYCSRPTTALENNKKLFVEGITGEAVLEDVVHRINSSKREPEISVRKSCHMRVTTNPHSNYTLPRIAVLVAADDPYVGPQRNRRNVWHSVVFGTIPKTILPKVPCESVRHI